MIEGNVILEHIFKDNFQGKKFWILVECHPSSVPAYSGIVMKRRPSLGSVGCVDCGSFGEN